MTNEKALSNFQQAFQNLAPRFSVENNRVRIDNRGQQFVVPLTPRATTSIGYSK